MLTVCVDCGTDVELPIDGIDGETMATVLTCCQRLHAAQAQESESKSRNDDDDDDESIIAARATLSGRFSLLVWLMGVARVCYRG